MTQRSYLSIGDVLTLLREEFPDITISKIRFLESQGLVSPQRSPSGYRKFFDEDVERLRYVLRQQREHFLPLKVIRDRLNGIESDEVMDDASEITPQTVSAAIGVSNGALQATAEIARTASSMSAAAERGPDRGVHSPAVPVAAATPRVSDLVAALQEGPAGATPAPPAPAPVSVPAPLPAVEAPGTSFTPEELATMTGLSESSIASLVDFGILQPIQVGGMTCFDEDGVATAKIAAAFEGYGVEPRHLRLFRNAADREAGLLEQLITPLLRQRNPDAHRRAEETADSLGALGGRLRAALLAREISKLLGR